MAWPQDHWYALADDTVINIQMDDPHVQDPDVLQSWRFRVVDGSVLRVLSGRLGIADPGYDLRGRTGRSDLGEVEIPAGSHPIRTTQADISRRDEATVLDSRTAYVSLMLAAGREVGRRKLALVPSGQEPPLLADDEFMGFGVDGGTACLVDAEAARRYFPDISAWFARNYPEHRWWLGEHSGEDAAVDADWFDALHESLNPHPKPGYQYQEVVNLTLPRALAGENLVAVRSGWGDGYYAVVGGYDANGRLLAVHVDFFLVPDPPGISWLMASVEPA